MDIQELRKIIDGIDDEMTRLFVKRMQAAEEVSRFKKENGMLVQDRTREREILFRVTENAPRELEAYVKTLFQTLFSMSRSRQNTIIAKNNRLAEDIKAAVEETPSLFPTKAVVACQGVEGAYSQIAADKLFSIADIMYFNSFEGVFRAVEKGLCRYGVLPVENSSHGSVTQVYDLMKKHNFHIVRSLKLKIDHSLLAKPGTVSGTLKRLSPTSRR